MGKSILKTLPPDEVRGVKVGIRSTKVKYLYNHLLKLQKKYNDLIKTAKEEDQLALDSLYIEGQITKHIILDIERMVN